MAGCNYDYSSYNLRCISPQPLSRSIGRRKGAFNLSLVGWALRAVDPPQQLARAIVRPGDSQNELILGNVRRKDLFSRRSENFFHSSGV